MFAACCGLVSALSRHHRRQQLGNAIAIHPPTYWQVRGCYGTRALAGQARAATRGTRADSFLGRNLLVPDHLLAEAFTYRLMADSPLWGLATSALVFLALGVCGHFATASIR